MKTFALLSSAALALVAACSSSVDGGGACAKDADCGADQVCGFAVSDACSAAGQCFAAPGATCAAYSPGCACDGTTINVTCTGLPEGYVSAPLDHAGECSDGGTADCCPVGWSFYACTFPDGGTGHACHNPAMGCASSLVCGEGCDAVVSGVCSQ
jgi:hypothetical protein